MTLRVALFLLCLGGGAVVGWLLRVPGATTAGVAVGAALWFAVETVQGARVLRWLKAGHLRGAPTVGGWWGEAAHRARRALA